MGIYIPDSIRLEELPADKDNYGFKIGTEGKGMHYALTYSSADESFGYHNAKDWFDFLKRWRKSLEHPVEVTILE